MFVFCPKYFLPPNIETRYINISFQKFKIEPIDHNVFSSPKTVIRKVSILKLVFYIS